MARARRSATTPAATAPGTDHRDLLAGLWEAAVHLRGSIEPADYKRYVLPIIFLRFLSLRYDRRRAELERLMDDPATDYHTTNPAHRAAVLADPDEYRSRGAVIVPEPARWANVVAAARRDDIKAHLDTLFDALEAAYPAELRGLLPRIYAGSNMDPEHLRGLIALFARDVFEKDHGGADLIGRVYEYFIGRFADSEGKRGGEFFTPGSIVRVLVAMLEPKAGRVYDPCCGSGGMFVEADRATGHNRDLVFYGQESKDFTWRLCRMNLFIHGLETNNVKLGNSYFNDQHPTLKADTILANPPFNDGSKSAAGWGADRIISDDPRLAVGTERLPLSPRNANTMWMLHFLHHLSPTGTAGFVMATGELSNGETARLAVRKALIDADLVDCVVQLSGQLFANTQIPCCLWFLSKNRGGAGGFRKRTGEVLFLDGRKLGALIPGSRTQRELSAEEVEKLAGACRQFRRAGVPAEEPGFCRVASLEEVRGHGYALTPGRYVGSAASDGEGEPFEELYPRLVAELDAQMQEAAKLDAAIRAALEGFADGE
ncbi:MAG: type I restriction-modification system subunit M [Gemmataceae bacterium]|nr:type I restriction-modification system subunit M [Gemmataceae bacterium]